jgi:hypothetical protein
MVSSRKRQRSSSMKRRVPECWMVHASPVITLAKARHLDLITALAMDILLPEAVVVEVLDGPATDPARQAVEEGWGTRVAASSVPVAVLEAGRGPGGADIAGRL